MSIRTEVSKHFAIYPSSMMSKTVYTFLFYAFTPYYNRPHKSSTPPNQIV